MAYLEPKGEYNIAPDFQVEHYASWLMIWKYENP